MKRHEENSGKPPDDATAKSHQDSVSSSNQFQISPGLSGVRDPIEGNPFSRSDPRHAIWQKATLKAEEEVCRLNSVYTAGFSKSESEFVTRFVALVGCKFDIWAKRYVQIVRTEEDVRGFDEWLLTFANSWLTDVAKKPYPCTVPKDFLLTELRAHLISRMEHWRAEARSLAMVAAGHEVANSSSQAVGTVGLEKSAALHTAELVATPPAAAGGTATPTTPALTSGPGGVIEEHKQTESGPRKSPRDEIREWQRKEELTNAQAASKLAVSASTFKSMKSAAKSKRRYSQATLDKVLSKIRK